MDYKRLYSSLQCSLLIIFDDEFIHRKPSKRHILHDFAMMDLIDQAELLGHIEEQDKGLAENLRGFAKEINPFFEQIDWQNEVIIDDIESAFSPLREKINRNSYGAIERCYYAIDEMALISQYQIMLQYGLCILVPSCYQLMLDEYYSSNGRRGKLRIFTDFTANTKCHFEKEVKSTSNENTMVCVIDNCLRDGYKAHEILDCISEHSAQGTHVIGTVFTSKQTEERIDEALCFVYTDKAKTEQLPMNLVRSAYHYFLARLQKEAVCQIDEAFSKAKQNKHIANYLSYCAVQEGISNYEAIQNWIHLIYEVQTAKSKAVKPLIRLAQIVDEFDAETEDDLSVMDGLLQDELNICEAFNYQVNDYHLPPMPGDIFMINEDFYILIGQDCDMTMAGTRHRRIAAAELLPVKEIIPITEPQKIKKNLNDVWINYFKHPNGDICCINVDFMHRKFIDSRILDLSTYHTSGLCKINTTADLESVVKEMLQPYLVGYYKELQTYFNAMMALQNNYGQELEQVMSNSQYVLTANRFVTSEDDLCYPISRVCRLKQMYSMYLYRLFLEYRGRQPFDSLNYAGSITQKICVKYFEKEAYLDVYVILGKDSNEKHMERCPWYVQKGELRHMLKQIGIKEKVVDDKDYIVFKGKEGRFCLEGEKVATLKKKKDGQAELVVEKVAQIKGA